MTDEMIDAVAERIYEDAHAGMTNIWGWNDSGLDDEHPGARERFLGYARSALTALATGSPASVTVSRAAEDYVAERGFEHSGGIIESVFSTPPDTTALRERVKVLEDVITDAIAEIRLMTTQADKTEGDPRKRSFYQGVDAARDTLEIHFKRAIGGNSGN